MFQPPLRNKNVDEVPLGTCICTFADTAALACIGLKRGWVTVALRDVSRIPAHLSCSTEDNIEESFRSCAPQSAKRLGSDKDSLDNRGLEELPVPTFELVQCLHGSPPLQRPEHAASGSQISIEVADDSTLSLSFLRPVKEVTYGSSNSEKLAR